MKCKEAQLLISNYLDGILKKEKEQYFLQHVKSCEKCGRELESTKSLLDMFSLIKPVEKESSFYRDIMTGFYQKRGEVRRSTSVIDKFAELIEKLARVYWGALQVGEPKVIPEDQCDKFKKIYNSLFANYPRKMLK